jgi:cytoskeletal protein CcmA (bactofilin family)
MFRGKFGRKRLTIIFYHNFIIFLKTDPMFTRKEDDFEPSAYMPGNNMVSSHTPSTPAASTPSAGREMNIISKGTNIQGDVICDGDLRIDGEVKGTIRSRSKIMVGPDGYVNGDIECVHAEVLGRVKGTLKVQDHLNLRGNARMEGDVLTTHFEMEPSVKFNGKCTMQDKVELAPLAKSSDRSAAATPASAVKPVSGPEKVNGEKENKSANGIFQKQAV